MAEPDDLLGKADALMARHRPGRTGGALRAEIPVLEEVVDLSLENDDLPLLTELVEPELVQNEQALAASLRTALLAAIEPEIAALIEQRLQQGLAPLIESLSHDLRGELHRIARDTLSDAIRTALERELERRKSDG